MEAEGCLQEDLELSDAEAYKQTKVDDIDNLGHWNIVIENHVLMWMC